MGGQNKDDVRQRGRSGPWLCGTRALAEPVRAISVLADVHQFEIHRVGTSQRRALRGEQPVYPLARSREPGPAPFANGHHVEPHRLDRLVEVRAFDIGDHFAQRRLDDLDQAPEHWGQALVLGSRLRAASGRHAKGDLSPPNDLSRRREPVFLSIART